eukprot:TRINITY_DN360_c0_g1_i2.p2 TRINITY_DN360_c0_g1~~TRINITY_DN360_c0_g1_i2.p2  ORF type:complete len:161 (-),score=42.26 TRINITY_DN360_c0_g1_i2:300-782(-)
MKFMVASMQAMLAAQIQSADGAQKKRSREVMEYVQKAPPSLEEAFSNFMAAMEAYDPTMQATAPKLRKMMDDYLTTTTSPAAVPTLRCIAEVSANATNALGYDHGSEDQTEDDEMYDSSSLPAPLQAPFVQAEIPDMLRMSLDMKNPDAFSGPYELGLSI